MRKGGSVKGEASTTRRKERTVPLSVGGRVDITVIEYQFREEGVSGLARDAFESAQEMFEGDVLDK